MSTTNGSGKHGVNGATGKEADSARPSNLRHERGPEPTREILNIEEAAELLGVSLKTFNKVLHSEDVPARKIGREWKFARRALIEWVGSGRASQFYRDDHEDEETQVRASTIVPEKPRTRRTAGWQIEYD
ncbi:MAG: helix-turn-helix domain-containing protein [Planctomycetes bacterium]|nr:helix-turn-helix domain-containing protein [Planctomycetota bacterium]